MPGLAGKLQALAAMHPYPARLSLGAGAFGMVAGALLPWVSVADPSGRSSTLNGLQVDGWLTGGIGLVLFFYALWSKGAPGRIYCFNGSILGGAVFLIVLAVVISQSYAIPEGGRG